MEVLHYGYHVLFHDLPPVTHESQEFPSYSLGSVQAHALQEEVNKMLAKCTMEVVDHLGLGFYSSLFLVQKVTGGWHPVIGLLALNRFVTFRFCMETVSSVLGCVCHVLD